MKLTFENILYCLLTFSTITGGSVDIVEYTQWCCFAFKPRYSLRTLKLWFLFSLFDYFFHFQVFDRICLFFVLFIDLVYWAFYIIYKCFGTCQKPLALPVPVLELIVGSSYLPMLLFLFI